MDKFTAAAIATARFEAAAEGWVDAQELYELAAAIRKLSWLAAAAPEAGLAAIAAITVGAEADREQIEDTIAEDETPEPAPGFEDVPAPPAARSTDWAARDANASAELRRRLVRFADPETIAFVESEVARLGWAGVGSREWFRSVGDQQGIAGIPVQVKETHWVNFRDEAIRF